MGHAVSRTARPFPRNTTGQCKALWLWSQRRAYAPDSEGQAMAGKKVTRQDLRDASEKYKNWGKWGPNDEIGTLNYTGADDIIAAARLVKKGKVISLALNFDHTGPQGAKSKY